MLLCNRKNIYNTSTGFSTDSLQFCYIIKAFKGNWYSPLKFNAVKKCNIPKSISLYLTNSVQYLPFFHMGFIGKETVNQDKSHSSFAKYLKFIGTVQVLIFNIFSSISETTINLNWFCRKTFWVLKLWHMPRTQNINWSIQSSEKSTGMSKSQHPEQGHLFIREQWLLRDKLLKTLCLALTWYLHNQVLNQDKQIYPYTVKFISQVCFSHFLFHFIPNILHQARSDSPVIYPHGIEGILQQSNSTWVADLIN